MEVDHDLSNDVSSILQAAADNEVTPFMKLFCKQQKKLLSSSCSGIQYHPMITRFCMSIHVKSLSFYEVLQNSKVLVLPSQRRLRDYRNAIKPQAAFQEVVWTH